MASKFLRQNFKSMNEEDKDKFNREATKAFNEYREKITGVANGEKELELLNKSLPKTVSSLNAMKKLLEEEMK